MVELSTLITLASITAIAPQEEALLLTRSEPVRDRGRPPPLK